MRRLIAVATVVIFAINSAAAAQEAGESDDYTERGPQFLAAALPTPVRVDVSRTPMLRRRISIDLRGVPLPEALRLVSEKSGVHLAFSNAMLPERTVHFQATNITVAAALTELLLDARVDVLFSQDGRGVLVRRQARTAPTGVIVGRVTDAKTGAGLVGTEVFLEGSRWRTTSDSSGRFRLTEVEPGDYSLTVRRLGYAKYTHQVQVRDDREDTVAVALEPVAAKLDELITTATGQQRRRDIGNAITTIQVDSVLRTAPIRNLTDLLQNRVPGLTMQHTSGAPGDPAKLRLRGLGSALRSNDPVVVVDGVRVYAAQSEARSGNLSSLGISQNTSGTLAGGAPAPSPLDQIDPNIIEKIEVFKGPSAATLYGADAANGVIVITTKRGKPGPTRWDAHLDYGHTDQPGRYPTAYYRWGHDLITDGARFCTLVDLFCVADSLVQFQALNVPSLTLLGQGRRTALSLTASGGTQALTYSVTGSYGSETGLLRLPDFEVARFRELHQRAAPDWMQRPHHYTNWSVTSNVRANLSATADVTLSTSLTRSEQQRTALENQLTPLMATYVDTLNQRYYQQRTNGDYVIDLTPDILRDYYQRTTASTVTFTTGLNASWRPRSWFTATGNAGLNVVPRDDQTVLQGGLLALTDSGSLARGTGRSLVSTVNVQGALRRPISHGFVFQTSLGANLTSTTTSDLTSSARIPPSTSGLIGATGFFATDNRVSTSVYGWYIEPTIAGQRLSLSTGLRLDGGSAYGTRISGLGGGGGGFLRGLLALPKLNGTWVISEEPWFPFQSLFSSLRLRGGYGQAQVQPGAADRLRLYDQTVLLTTLGNTQLRPERSTELEGGFDADLLDSRVSVEFTAYRKLTVDALMSLRVPPSVDGGVSVLTNIGNVRNRGMELVVGLTPVRSPALTWATQLLYSRNTNTLLKLGRGVAENKLEGLVEGFPVNSRWDYPIVGFADQNGDGIVQRSEVQVGDSLVYLGRLQPAYTAALHSNIALFGGAVGITASLSYDAGATQINGPAGASWVLARALVDPSAPLIDQAAMLAFQAYTGGSDGATVLSHETGYGMYQEVSTLRFQSLAVNYRAPARVARLLRAQQLTVALQGSNLGLHSTYRGKDPDVNAWTPGEGIRDGGQLPQPRTWQLAFYLAY